MNEVRAPPGAQHSASVKAITARQLQALVRQHAWVTILAPLVRVDQPPGFTEIP